MGRYLLLIAAVRCPTFLIARSWKQIDVIIAPGHDGEYVEPGSSSISPPRQFPTSGFQILDTTQPIEEETYSWYNPKNYYPVRIGDVHHSYQVIGKLGYGGYSTTVMKVCTRTAPDVKREVEAYRRINAVSPLLQHGGRTCVRKMLEEFELTDEYGKYQCIVHDPLFISLYKFRQECFLESRLTKDLTRACILVILYALDFLHNHAGLIHTDLQENNIILELDDPAALSEFEEQELNDPSPRKIVGDRVIYTSRELQLAMMAYGQPVLCDFGQARFSEVQHSGQIQPYQYRAPEVIFGMKWDEKADIWNLGVMIWDISMGRNMFKVRGGPDNEEADVYHLAHMVALLGPPPVDFFRRWTTDTPWEYFDEEGECECIPGLLMVVLLITHDGSTMVPPTQYHPVATVEVGEPSEDKIHERHCACKVHAPT
ncbi:kinase-like protein [Fistulina hepatica ATCC 64428]|uniref:Kinase-like protein n=1 Tax=Fistulina hepatica ATCC 64428 TaxID=1128425 RepID=A0A0D7AS19_9AGAR|nr:kinase-like protein [Fistulina hepatica ATCC 64428]